MAGRSLVKRLKGMLTPGSVLREEEASAVRSAVSGGGVGGTTITRSALIALADAGALVPRATYVDDLGVISIAVTARYLQSITPWYAYGSKTAVGSATTETTMLGGLYIPPVGPSGTVRVRFFVEFDDNTNNSPRSIWLRQVGYNSAMPLFTRNLTTAGQLDGRIEVELMCQGSSSAQLVRSPGNSAQGMGTSIARPFAIDLNTSKELALSGLTAKSGTLVNINALSKAGGVATGTVAAGTFGGLHMARVAAITGAGDTTFNGDPIQIALVGSDPASATEFTFTLSGNGSAGGTPQIQLYRYFTISAVQVWVDQGIVVG